jgi:hypothetical protein
MHQHTYYGLTTARFWALFSIYLRALVRMSASDQLDGVWVHGEHGEKKRMALGKAMHGSDRIGFLSFSFSFSAGRFGWHASSIFLALFSLLSSIIGRITSQHVTSPREDRGNHLLGWIWSLGQSWFGFSQTGLGVGLTFFSGISVRHLMGLALGVSGA